MLRSMMMTRKIRNPIRKTTTMIAGPTTMTMTETEAIEKALLKPRRRRMVVETSRMLSSGSTILNLACTGNARGAFLMGHYYYMVGDSVSGKTWLTLSALAEASINKHFDNHRFIYDGSEYGALMDIRKFFGLKMAERMETPGVDGEGAPIYSQTIEDFYFNVDDALGDDRPFVYILDSMDALSSDYEGKKFDERKKAKRKGTEAKGDYGDGKAKINSGGIRRILSKLQNTDSILIVVGQTRDNVGGGLFEPSKVHSGGHALKFYATLQLWSSMGGKLKKTVNNKPRQIGIKAKIALKKNRITGRERTVEIPIYHSFGIDDLGSCIDYLVDEGHWKKTKNTIGAKELGLEQTRGYLIKSIEEQELEMDLRETVSDVWQAIDEACSLKRKSRYSQEEDDAGSVEKEEREADHQRRHHDRGRRRQG
jgi:hypothetical protein